MSEVKDFRPHLSSREIRFLLNVIGYAQRFMDSQEQNYKRIDWRMEEIKRELRRGCMDMNLVRELKALKEQFDNAKALPFWIHEQRNMLDSLKRRLESILKGGKAHRHWLYNFNLKQAMPKSNGTKNT